MTIRVRAEVWNLRSHRCFRALKRAFAGGCARFGFRLVHFSVQRNHIHCIVEAPEAVTLGRAMKGLEVRMARVLNRIMRRRGQVFADRYHAHLLSSIQEAAQALRYVLENWRVHALRVGARPPEGIDPRCSDAWRDRAPPLVMEPGYWMLTAGVEPRGFRTAA